MTNCNIDFQSEIQKEIKDLSSFEIKFSEKFERVKNQKGKSNFCYIASSWLYKGKEYAILSFIDWSLMSEYKRLKSWSDNDLQHYSEKERAEIKAECEKKQKEIREKEAIQRAEKIKEAKEIYEKFKDNKLTLENYKNTYLNDKGFTFEEVSKADSSLFLGNDRFGEFVGYPLYLKNEFVGIQKLYRKQGNSNNKYFQGLAGVHGIGNLEKENLDIVYIAEGLATGLSLYLALNKPVYIAGSCTNFEKCLREVISQVRAINPNCLIIFACDRDKSKAGEIAAIKACKGHLGVSYKLPYLSDSLLDKENEKLDFDDLRTLESLDSIRKQLDPVKLIENFYQDYSSFSEKSLKAMIREREKEVKSLERKSVNEKDLIELEKKLNCKDLITELLNREIAFTHIGGATSFIDNKAITERDSFEIYTKDYLIDKYSNKLGFIGFGKEKAKYENYFKIYLTNRNRKDFDYIEFDPSSKALENNKCFNLFKGFKYAPNQEIDTLFFWDHAFKALCNENQEAFSYLKKYLAHIFQKPYELPRIALVWAESGQGIGKGTFFNAIHSLLGYYCQVFDSSDQLTGRFNKESCNKLLVIANEATWGGDKQKEGILKAFITDPFRNLELKHKEAVRVRNFTRLIVTSNEDWAVPVGLDDRRFIFFKANKEFEGNIEYFKDFQSKINNESFLRSLMFDLMREDLSNFKPTERPKSLANNSLSHKIKTMSNVAKFWYDCLGYEYNCLLLESYEWIETLYKRDLTDLFFDDYCKKHKVAHPPSKQGFWIELKKYLPKSVKFNENQIFISGRAGNRDRTLENLKFSECKDFFNKEILKLEI
jgi:phage/plasmid primase-like uncharacterized protein